MMEPDMRPSTATMVYGMRYQMGRMEAIAPIGSLPTFSASLALDPASSRP